ncbi:MAG: DegT/DnrJ/EryC1/StrS aminotransferase family protein [Deltaproteobacteria bacterium]
MLNTKFSPWPSFTLEEAQAVSRVLLSNKVNYWTGTECREFEKDFARWCGAKYTVALANGTVALDIALKALGIGHGDEVVVTPRTFIASVSCVVNAGAIPIFADVDANDGNLSAETIAKVISPKTKAIICVHLGGMPCDMTPIMALAHKYGIKVIEDCAQAHGASYHGCNVGSIGDIGVWSFCQDKIMTTGGEGGMVTTNDKSLWSKMWSYKDHGKSWDAVYECEHSEGYKWVHDSFGTNWRMTEMQAAIGRIQLQRIDDWTKKRTGNALRIADVCQQFSAIRVANISDDVVHAYYKFCVFVQPENLRSGWSRDRIIAEINDRGVPCYSGTCPEVYLEKAFDGTGWRPVMRLSVARELGETSMMFLVHPTLSGDEINETCSVIKTVFSEASR